MKTRMFGLRFVIGVCFIFALTCLYSNAFAAKKMLRFQVNYTGTSYGGEIMKYFASQVEEISGGKMAVQLFFEGQILKTMEAFDALQKGMVDGLYSTLLYYSGVVKEANWEWLPYSWQDANTAVEFYTKRGALSLMREALAQHDVYYLVPVPMGTLGFLTKFSVSTLADFKGKKIRGMGIQAQIIELLGATPVSLSAAEQYTALQRGTLDATIFPWYTIETYKFYEVVDYIVTPGLFSPCVIDILMNKKTWQSLSPDEQGYITRAAEATMYNAAKLNEQWDRDGIEACNKHKVQIIKIADAEFRNFREAVRPLWEKTAERSELSRKAVTALQSYLKGE